MKIFDILQCCEYVYLKRFLTAVGAAQLVE